MKRLRWPSMRMVGPRAVRVPKPRSVNDMIKADDHWALQTAICSPPAVMMSISAHDTEFWDKQWPNLLRQACKHSKPKCLALLLQLHDYDYHAPPVPPQLLSWMMVGWEVENSKFSFMDAHLMETILSRVKNSPVAFKAEDGLTILKNGGPEAYFYGPTPNASLDEVPGVVEAWHKWSGSTKNQEGALKLIKDNFSNDPWNGYIKISAVRDLILAIPEKKQAAFIQQHAQVIHQSYVAYRLEEESLAKMTNLLGLYLKQDWIKDTAPVWESWFQHIFKHLDNNAISTSVADSFTRIMETLHSARQPPPGFMWTDQIATHWFMGRGPKIHKILHSYEKSQRIPEQEISDTTRWLQESMKVWDTLTSWGIVEPVDIKNWITAHHKALGEQWEDRMHQMVVNCATDPNMSALVMTWSKWQKRTLALHIVDVPDRAKERGMKM